MSDTNPFGPLEYISRPLEIFMNKYLKTPPPVRKIWAGRIYERLKYSDSQDLEFVRFYTIEKEQIINITEAVATIVPCYDKKRKAILQMKKGIGPARSIILLGSYVSQMEKAMQGELFKNERYAKMECKILDLQPTGGLFSEEPAKNKEVLRIWGESVHRTKDFDFVRFFTILNNSIVDITADIANAAALDYSHKKRAIREKASGYYGQGQWSIQRLREVIAETVGKKSPNPVEYYLL
jgi:hypothetical protein